MVLLSIICTTQLCAQMKGSLKGVVIDAQNKAIPNASVVLEPDHRVAIANRKGEFDFRGLYTGTYQLKVTAIGYSDYTTEIEISGTNNHPLRLPICSIALRVMIVLGITVLIISIRLSGFL